MTTTIVRPIHRSSSSSYFPGTRAGTRDLAQREHPSARGADTRADNLLATDLEDELVDDDLAADTASTSVASFLATLGSLTLVSQVTIDLSRREVSVDGQPRHLAARELALLAHLAGAAGRVVSREELFRTVWNGHDVTSGSRTVDVHIRRLRAKLNVPSLITTVRGEGYRFNAQVGVAVIR